MATLISWIVNLLGGIGLVIAATMFLAAILSIPMALLGAVRRRCPFSAIFIFAAVAAVTGGLGVGIFWIIRKLTVPGAFSTTLLYGSLLTSGIAGAKELVRLLAANWLNTNVQPGLGNASVPMQRLTLLEEAAKQDGLVNPFPAPGNSSDSKSA